MDSKRNLKGYIALRDILFSDPEEKIKDRNQNRYFYEALLKCPAEIFNFKIMLVFFKRINKIRRFV